MEQAANVGESRHLGLIELEKQTRTGSDHPLRRYSSIRIFQDWIWSNRK